MTRRASAFLFVLLLALPDAARTEDPAAAGIDEVGTLLFRKVDPSVVSIQHEQGLGSGFVVSADGLILTNGHVIIDPQNPDPEEPTRTMSRITVTLADGTRYKARVIGHCLDPDVALLKIDADGPLVSAAIGNAREVRTGQHVYALGTPKGLKRTLTSGIISNNERADMGTLTKVFQIDAAINPGNSGGPLFNERGEVLGINTYGGGGENFGFTIPIDVAWTLKEHFLAFGRFRRADIPGLVLQELHDELARALGADTAGVLVDDVLPDSPAARAGFHPGDVITSLNGIPVAAPTRAALLDFHWTLTTLAPGETAAFAVRRRTADGWRDIAIAAPVLEEDPLPPHGRNITGELPGIRFDELGLGIRRLVLASRILNRLPEADGVHVTTVEPASPAQAADLAVNDIVLAVDGRPTPSPEALTEAIDRLCARRTPAIVLDVRRGNLSFETAIAPPYKLAGKTVGLISVGAPHTDLVRRFFVTNGASVREIDPDASFDAAGLDAIVLLNGEDAGRLRSAEPVLAAIRALHRRGRPVAALGSAAAVIPAAGGALRAKRVTSDAETAGEISRLKGNYTGNDVQTDDNVITATGESRAVVRAFLNQIRREMLKGR